MTFVWPNHVSDNTKSSSDKKKPKQNKLDKLDFIKINKFCAANDTINKMKRQPKQGEAVLANNMCNKEHI